VVAVKEKMEGEVVKEEVVEKEMREGVAVEARRKAMQAELKKKQLEKLEGGTEAKQQLFSSRPLVFCRRGGVGGGIVAVLQCLQAVVLSQREKL
jgi:hypothetical protein